MVKEFQNRSAFGKLTEKSMFLSHSGQWASFFAPRCTLCRKKGATLFL